MDESAAAGRDVAARGRGAQASASKGESRSVEPASAVGTSAQRFDLTADAFGGQEGILVLPHAHDVPSSSSERGVGVSIPCLVREELVPPPLGVTARPGRVQRAHVPEAAVDEDGEARPGEHDVRATAHAGEGRDINAVAQAGGVQVAPNEHFRRRVRPALALHPLSRRSVRRGRSVGHPQMRRKVASYRPATRRSIAP